MTAEQQPNQFYIPAQGPRAHTQLMLHALMEFGTIRLSAIGLPATLSAWNCAQAVAFDLFKYHKRYVVVAPVYSHFEADRGPTQRFIVNIHLEGN